MFASRGFAGGVLKASTRSRARWIGFIVSITLTIALGIVVTESGATAVPAVAPPNASGPLVASDVRSAQLTAKVRKQRVEVLSERAEDATTWVNPDGSFTTESFGAPVRVPDKHGKDGWSDVDLEIVERSDGTVGPRVHPQGLALAGKTGPGGGLLASLTDQRGRQIELNWKGALPKPTLSGTKATYTDISAGVDLVQEATRTGVEQFLVLKNKAAVDAAVAAAKDGSYEIRLPVKTRGLTAKARPDGGVDFVDSKGASIQTIPAPRMWDAQMVPNADVPANEHPVSMSFVATAGKGQGDLVLQAETKWLSDAARSFPITIDPTTTLAASHDTWVQEGYTTAQAGSTELRVGTFDGSTVARSFMKWNTSGFKGVDVTSATLSLWEFHSWSCTARAMNVHASYISDTSTTWANQPATAGPAWYAPSFAKGYSTSCADGWVNIGITNLAQAWADQTTVPYHSIRLSAANEADVYGWKKFNSANAASNVPKVSVTYNRYPNTPGTATHTPGTSSATTVAGWSTSATPTLKAVVSDQDGGSVKGLFSVYLNGTGTPIIDKAPGSSVTSGGTSQYVVPAGKLTNGSWYLVRVFANDGVLTSANWSNYDRFTVDTSLPATPTVTSSTSPEGLWSDTLDANGKIAFSAKGTSTDNAKVQYSLDAATYATTLTALPNASVAIALAPPSVGQHTLYVRSLDTAGNVSAGRSYTFFFGSGVGLKQPVQDQVTSRRVPLQLTVAPGLSLGTSTFQFAKVNADPTQSALWGDIPLSDVTDASGATLTAWPASGGAVYYWDAPATLTRTTLGGNPDGSAWVVDVRAKFSGGFPSTDASTVTVDLDGSQGASAPGGPGTVNLSTGELTISQADATLFGATIGRSYQSRAGSAGALAQDSPFGPEWTLDGGSAIAQSDWQAVHKTSPTAVELIAGDGSAIGFSAPDSGTQWIPEPGSENLVLAGTLATTFTLTEPNKATSTFTKPAGAPADTWPLTSTAPSSSSTAGGEALGYEANAGKLRLRRIAASNSALTAAAQSTCADPTVPLATAARGCRVLELTWSDPDALGPVTARVTSVSAWAWNPSTSAMTGSTEVTYSYDSTGRLVKVTNPKPSLVVGGLQLDTTYGYGPNGLLTTVSPPGQLPWTIGYATGGALVAAPTWDRTRPDSQGRVVSVARPTLAAGSATTTNGTATTSFVYGVPVTATMGAVAVDPDSVDDWGQTSFPIEGTAVFDVDAAAQPLNDYWAADDTVRRSWSKATVTYVDSSGRPTNTLTRDGLLDSTTYDAVGTPVMELSGANRALAMGLGADSPATLAELGLLGATSVARGGALAQVSQYEAGTGGASRLAWTQGPLHTVVTSVGAQDQHRLTTRFLYNAGRPAGSSDADALTSTTAGGLPLDSDPSTASLDNSRTTSSTYDWGLYLPTATTVDPSPVAGDEIVSRTVYDGKGRLKQTRQPSDATGVTAGTRLTTYWDENIGACTGHPEWGDLVCQTSFAAPITGSTVRPTTTMTYTRTGDTATVSEGANAATRTTTITYDAAERPASVSATSTGLGAPPATQTLAYDPTTGAAASITSAGKSIITAEDKLGRPLTYTDATGLRTSTSYDALDRPFSVVQTDTTGAVARTFTTTVSYDPTSGRLTSQTDTQAGTLNLGYDSAGNASVTTLGAASASGLKSSSKFDVTGAEIERVWTMTGLTDPVLSESAFANIHGQQVDHTMMPGGHRDYRYDSIGRLIAVTDRDAGNCDTRAYRFDVNSNRTGASSTSSIATADGSGDLTVCPTPTTPAATSPFDSADRLTLTGYTYDAFGRTTRTPLPGGQVARVGYNANDMVATQSVFANSADADANGGAGSSPLDTSTYTMDPTGQRIASRTAQITDPDTLVTSTAMKVMRYDGSSDSAAWTDEGDGTITRSISSPQGLLAALAGTVKSDATATNDQVQWALTDLHGDVTATLPANDSAPMQVSRPDEYGAGSTDAPRYGWLGGYERAGDTPGGLVLMGVRLYDANTGRFLSSDPVFGGGANSYAYPTDPVNGYDLDGQMWGWVWEGIMFGFEQGLAKTCEAFVPVAWYVCEGIAGFIAGGIKYIGKAKFVSHKSWSWAGALGSAFAGMAESLALARFLRTPVGKRVSGWIKGYLVRLRDWAVSKLRRMGWASLAGFVFTLSTALNVAFCSEPGRKPSCGT